MSTIAKCTGEKFSTPTNTATGTLEYHIKTGKPSKFKKILKRVYISLIRDQKRRAARYILANLFLVKDPEKQREIKVSMEKTLKYKKM